MGSMWVLAGWTKKLELVRLSVRRTTNLQFLPDARTYLLRPFRPSQIINLYALIINIL